MSRLLVGLALAPGLEAALSALIELHGQGLATEAVPRCLHVEPFGQELRQLLLGLTAGGTQELRTLAAADRAVGEALALTANRLADRAQIRMAQILAAGVARLPVLHDGDGPVPCLLSLGSAPVIAERTGLTVASDFGWRDLAAGGQAEPLAALPDFLLFRSADESRAILHLDELSSVVLLPGGDDERRVRGALAGPGCAFLDALMRQLTGGREPSDATGHFAVQGRCVPELLERWRKHPFLLKRWPKSASRSTFGEELARQTLGLAQTHRWDARDLLCTANHWVAEALAGAIRHLAEANVPKRLVLVGGGTRNGLLWRLLGEHFPKANLSRGDELGWPADSIPAVSAALLASLLIDREPANLTAATGAGGQRLLGTLTPGTLTHWSACLAFMTGQPNFHLEEDDG